MRSAAAPTLALLALASSALSATFGLIDAFTNASLLSTLAPSYSFIIVGGGNGAPLFP